jgi:hypothetical protein
MKWFSVIICGFLISSCTPTEVTLDKLELRESKYFLIDSEKPFNGKLITEFEKGKVASEIPVKEGIPKGKWLAYGYHHEIVQEGKFNPIDVNNEKEFINRGVKRINICDTKEGNIEFTKIYVIYDKQIENFDLKAQILSLLRDRSIHIKGDTIEKIIYVPGEFSE